MSEFLLAQYSQKSLMMFSHGAYFLLVIGVPKQSCFIDAFHLYNCSSREDFSASWNVFWGFFFVDSATNLIHIWNRFCYGVLSIRILTSLHFIVHFLLIQFLVFCTMFALFRVSNFIAVLSCEMRSNCVIVLVNSVQHFSCTKQENQADLWRRFVLHLLISSLDTSISLFHFLTLTWKSFWCVYK